MQLTSRSFIPRRLTRRLPTLAGLVPVAILAACVAGCQSDDAEDAVADESSSLNEQDVQRLRDVVRRDPLTPELATACPSSRSDEVCLALREAESARTPEALSRARAAVARRIATGPRAAALSDTAVKYWLRERSHGLTALHAIAGLRAPATAPAGFAASVDEHLRARYPLYEPSTFRLAHAYLPPSPSSASCEGRTEALLVFPGVIRLPTKNELSEHVEAVRAALPCLHVERVETGTFVSVESNAIEGRRAVERIDRKLGRVPLHFLGYSQGSSNALRTIASDPAIAARTRSVVSLNSVSHGSEAADAMLRAMRLYDERPTAGCDELWPGVRDLCKLAAQRQLAPIAGFMQSTLERMGAHFDDLEGSNVGEWLDRHVDGLRSLTTGASEAQWAIDGPKLPKDVTYLSLRSVISDERASLPQSNWLSYQLLWRASQTAPWNDMQVRLVNQHLGREVAPTEVVGRVAAGNHWLWALSPADVPEKLMPAKMFEGVPRAALLAAAYEALAEVGIVGAGGGR